MNQQDDPNRRAELELLALLSAVRRQVDALHGAEHLADVLDGLRPHLAQTELRLAQNAAPYMVQILYNQHRDSDMSCVAAR